MKTHPLFIFVAVAALAGCDRLASQSSQFQAQADAQAQAEAYDRYLKKAEEREKEDDELRKRQVAHADITERDLERQRQYLDQGEEQVKRMNALLEKWEEQAKRYDAILTRWEQQSAPGVLANRNRSFGASFPLAGGLPRGHNPAS